MDIKFDDCVLETIEFHQKLHALWSAILLACRPGERQLPRILQSDPATDGLRVSAEQAVPGHIQEPP